MGFIGFPQQQNPVSSLRNYRRFVVGATANSSGGASNSGMFTGGCFVGCGTTATAYGKISWNSAFSQQTIRTGAGVDLASGIGVAGVGMFSLDTAVAGQAIRLIVGDDTASTAPANSANNAISTRGFGFEIYNNSGTRTIRLFAHDGITYSTSSGLTTFDFSSINRYYGFWVKNDPAGNVYLFMSQTSGNNVGPLPDFASSPVLTMTGGPTANTSAKRYVTFQAITDGTNNPNNVNATTAQIEETIFTVGV